MGRSKARTRRRWKIWRTGINLIAVGTGREGWRTGNKLIAVGTGREGRAVVRIVCTGPVVDARACQRPATLRVVGPGGRGGAHFG